MAEGLVHDLQGWTGQESFLEPEVLDTLRASDYFSAHYRNERNSEGLELYIAYYGKQGIGTSIHSPANCIPGGGWKISENKLIDISLENTKLPVSKMLIEKGNNKLLVYYWFSQRGRIINSQYGAKFYLFVDSILKNRSDGALIRITAPLPSGTSESEVDAKIQSFLKKAYPAIEHHIPD